jgi:acyl carrier protein
MLAYPGVRQAVVMVRLRESGDKYLAAYYVSDHGLSMAELRGNLREKLPDYMIPSFFVQMTELPLTANGKLDRKALPDPIIVRNDEPDIPITQLQRDLVRIWAEVLEIEEQKIGISINFFDLGGTSLKLLKLVDKIRRFFNREISIAKLFFFPTVSSLAEFLSRGYDDGPDAQADNDVDQMTSTLTIIESENI